MIFVLAKLMKPCAELMTVNDENYNRVYLVDGEMAGKVGMGYYSHGPEKYSMKNLNLSLLFLPVNDLFDLMFG